MSKTLSVELGRKLNFKDREKKKKTGKKANQQIL
jgi:hypothetical protein